jgi:hypothetical protein
LELTLVDHSITCLNKNNGKNISLLLTNNNKELISIIEYAHLIRLHLLRIHDDYVEQFLFDTKTCLPNDIHLIIGYDILQRVTHNFTRDAIRIDYSKVKDLEFHDQVDLSKYV